MRQVIRRVKVATAMATVAADAAKEERVATAFASEQVSAYPRLPLAKTAMRTPSVMEEVGTVQATVEVVSVVQEAEEAMAAGQEVDAVATSLLAGETILARAKAMDPEATSGVRRALTALNSEKKGVTKEVVATEVNASVRRS
jgi:hypothetical protein